MKMETFVRMDMRILIIILTGILITMKMVMATRMMQTAAAVTAVHVDQICPNRIRWQLCLIIC